LQRGNFFAFFYFAFILFAVLGLKKGKVLLPILLIALAANIRTNLIIYAALLCFWPTISFTGPIFVAIVSLLIFIVALFFDSHIYSDYTLDNFLKGLEIYNALFVTGDWGFSYSTSIFTLLKFIFKLLGLKFVAVYAINFQIACAALCGIYFSWLYLKKLIRDTSYVFLLTALSMLGTPLFADYHLLLFALSAILVLMNQFDKDQLNTQRKKIDNTIFFACCLMLSPLN